MGMERVGVCRYNLNRQNDSRRGPQTLTRNEDTESSAIIADQRHKKHVLRDLPPLGVPVISIGYAGLSNLHHPSRGQKPSTLISYQSVAYQINLEDNASHVTQSWARALSSPYFSHYYSWWEKLSVFGKIQTSRQFLSISKPRSYTRD